MASTTFSGPVRSLGGFIGATQNSTTGAYTNNFVVDQFGNVELSQVTTISGTVASTLIQLQGIVTGTLSATTGDSIAEFEQPANSVIKSISLLCVTAATVASGNIGFEVGTTSSGAEIVATDANDVLSSGTSVPAGAFYNTTLLNTTAQSASPAASPLYTSSKRNIYLNITNTTTPSARGSFRWIIEYSKVA
jgi:hypothetical protein